MQAPIAGALMPSLRWVVVRDEALRAKIAAPVREAGYKSQAKYGHLVDEKSVTSGRHCSTCWTACRCSSCYACVGSRETTPRSRTRSTARRTRPSGACSWPCARGLGSTFVGYHLADREQEVAALLGIPHDVTQITLLPVAYTTTTEFRSAARPHIEETTYYDGWGG
jgi:hypothetical protein